MKRDIPLKITPNVNLKCALHNQILLARNEFELGSSQ